MSEAKTHATYSLPVELVEKLDKLSKKSRISKSKLVEGAIENEIKLMESKK